MNKHPNNARAGGGARDGISHWPKRGGDAAAAAAVEATPTSTPTPRRDRGRVIVALSSSASALSVCTQERFARYHWYAFTRRRRRQYLFARPTPTRRRWTRTRRNLHRNAATLPENAFAATFFALDIRTLGPTQNGRWRYTGELERQEAVRARVVVALLPAGVFLDRRSSRYGSLSTQPTRPRRAFAYVRLSLPCALFVFCSSPAVGHRHGVGLQVRVQRQQPVVVHQRRGQVHFTSSGHLPRQPQRQFYGQQHRIHLPSMFCVRSFLRSHHRVTKISLPPPTKEKLSVTPYVFISAIFEYDPISDTLL